MDLEDWLRTEEYVKNIGVQKKKLENGDIIDLAKVVKTEYKEYEFGDRKVGRFIYYTEDGEQIIVPKTLHKHILAIIKKYGKDIKIEVQKEGAGTNTKYFALPVLER